MHSLLFEQFHSLHCSVVFSPLQNYLERFFGDVGTSNTTMRSVTNHSFQDTLEAMQSFYGLEVTGSLDNNTIEVMKAPRCGVSDISRYGHFQGRPRWEKQLVTYR